MSGGRWGTESSAAGTSRERVPAAGVVSLLWGVPGSWLPAAGLPSSGVEGEGEGAVGMLFSSGMVGGSLWVTWLSPVLSPQRRGEVVGEVVLLRHVDWIRVLSQGREREVTRQSIRVSVISPVVVVGVVGISSVVCAVVSALPVSVGVTSAVVVSLIMSPAVVVGLPLVVPVQMIVGLRWFPVELVRIALSVVTVSSRVAVRVVLLPAVFHVEPAVFVVDSFPLLLVVLDLLPLSRRKVSC